MCGLFGLLNYGGNEIKNMSDITNALAEEAAIRGTDATGIAFNHKNRINISKDSKSAYRMTLKHPDDAVAVTGHTRHSTQGSEKKNYNNHPFAGKCKNARFSLAHNGIISNDFDLRKKYNLPKTKIETDSYIAVQLLEHASKFSMESIKFMAEAVEGSFSFYILDDRNNLYLVKGDSPLTIIHFPNLKLYVYASTESILWKALVDTDLFEELKLGQYEYIEINMGEILKISSSGLLTRAKFNYTESYFGYSWRSYYRDLDDAYPTDYISDLKAVATCQGYEPETIDELLEGGFTLEEIEEYIYC